MSSIELKAPRLQFRWKKEKPGARHDWIARYELVLPLHEHDIRRERRGCSKGEYTVRLGSTRRGSTSTELPNDAPFRDGAHAKWDGKALGGLPVYVIDPAGAVHFNERDQPGFDPIPIGPRRAADADDTNARPGRAA